MTANTMNCNTNSLSFASLPATKALEQERRKLMVAKEGRRASLNKIDLELFALTFDDEANSFPTIAWDSEDESDSDSVRSLDTWNCLIAKSDSMTSLGKRGRGESGSRRLVRSKKIKSDLSSLALGLTA
eukprot:CAMPEP_0170243890 /NCGR_PEP_ID=MMETSP0116_2-20130129/21723_1 /TAXON_ID=400756 /ORGANISM="Durinskia baltica, Strain CSIRO CS-38" /LENGTH=128 /DNA_ID=CAMNT_0010494749 /DNA_START=76 /DNA_END=462 /DNA_ORIENTATION=-